MFGFGIAHGKFDPSQLSLTGFWRANHSGDSPWLGNLSRGTSGSFHLSSMVANGYSIPTVGTLTNNYSPAKYAESHALGSGTIQRYIKPTFSDTAGSFWCLFNTLTTFAPGAPYADIVLFGDFYNGEIGFGFTTGGITFTIYNAGYVERSIACGLGSWHLAQWKYDGTNTYGRLDGDAWQSWSGGTFAGSDLTNSDNRLATGLSWSGGNRYNGQILDMGCSNTVISDVDFERIRLYCMRRYNLYAPVFPETLKLTGWWRASYSGSPWKPTVSAGVSFSYDMTEATNPPATGSAINGFISADFNGANSKLASPYNISTFVTAGAWSIWTLIFVDAISYTGTNYYLGNGIVTDTAAFWGITMSTNGGNKVYATTYGGTWNAIGASITTGTWQLVQSKYDGTTMSIRVNAGAWSTLTCAAMDNPNSPLTFGMSFGTTFFNGQMLETAVSKTVFSDAEFENVRLYCNTRYGLSL